MRLETIVKTKSQTKKVVWLFYEEDTTEFNSCPRIADRYIFLTTVIVPKYFKFELFMKS